MNTIKFDSRNSLVVAHRGLSGIEKENTCPAFVAAGNRSYYGVETDVHVTSDREFVIIHDDSTGGLTLGAIDINVEESSYSELKDIILPDLDGSTTRSDIRIPLLKDYVKICKKYGKKCILELKNPFTPLDISRMVEEIRAIDYLENVVFISFDFENCKELRSLLPSSEIQFLWEHPITDELIKSLVDYKLELDVYHEFVNKELIKKLHSSGILVNVWTCDGKEVAEALADMGVDYITTNILE